MASSTRSTSSERRRSAPARKQGTAASKANKYFKLRGRYYDVQSFQFAAGGPDADLGAIVFDVTGLPDTTTINEVGRIRVPEAPGGFHNVYTYKHSDGRVLMFSREAANNRGSQIWSVDVTGRNEQRVLTPGDASDPAWSPLIQ